MKQHNINPGYSLDNKSVVYFTKVKDSPELTNLVISRVNSIQTICLNKIEFAMLKREIDKWEV